MARKLIVLYLLLMNCYSFSYGQEQQPAANPPDFKKNAVQATAGTVGLVAGYSLSYERRLLTSKQSTFVGLWAKIGAGEWASWTSGGPQQSLQLGTMTGRKSSHLELNFGLARLMDKSAFHDAKELNDFYGDPPPSKSAFVDITPAGNIGYRFQKPQGHFLFRVGGGFPETLYLGIGAAF